MSDDYARVLSIVGLAFNLVGVLMLFRWGMPFRVESQGKVGLTTGDIDASALALDHIYAICGWIGLGFSHRRVCPPTGRVTSAADPAAAVSENRETLPLVSGSGVVNPVAASRVSGAGARAPKAEQALEPGTLHPTIRPSSLP
ncbi:MAG: hypothetical protein ACJ8AH_19260 [Stellaceae bacterium]|jgi:hypothetical protein